VAGLERGCQANLIVEAFSLGSDIVGRHRSVGFVKEPDAVVVHRNVCGRLDQPSRLYLRPRATIELSQRESTIG